jgi:hypothetical protein
VLHQHKQARQVHKQVLVLTNQELQHKLILLQIKAEHSLQQKAKREKAQVTLQQLLQDLQGTDRVLQEATGLLQVHQEAEQEQELVHQDLVVAQELLAVEWELELVQDLVAVQELQDLVQEPEPVVVWEPVAKNNIAINKYKASAMQGLYILVLLR